MQNVRMSERLAVVGVVDPFIVINTEKYTDYIDMLQWEQCLGIAMLGDVNSKTFDFTAYGYSDDAGNDETELKACTRLAASASDNDNDQMVIGVRRQDLVAKGTTSVVLRYVRFGLVSEAAQDGPCAVLALGGDPRYGLARELDLDSVVEIEEDLS